jgi:diguanylate cyclase (GGDEF)-like protein
MVAVAPRDITLPELEEMLRSIPGESWALVDEAAQVVYAVGPVGGVVGHGAREGTHIAEYVHPDDLPRVLDAMSRILAAPESVVTVRARVMHGDGSWRQFDVTAINRIADERVRAVVVRTVEVHEPVPHGDDLVGSLAEAVPTPILVVDHVGNVLFTNSAARSLLGDEVERITAQLKAARAGGSARVTFEHRTRWIHARIADQSEGWVAMLDDITVQRDTEEQLYRLAMTDQLTDVANRTSFDRKLAQVLEQAGDDTPVSVVFVDLDGFKGVNDRHGHAAGDKVLQVVAARLKKEVRPGDTVARIGGDEFGVICEGLTAEDAPGFAERLADAVRERIAIGDGRVVVGASAGTATSPPAPRDAAGLLAAADRAMYRDKAVESWTPELEL